MYTKICLFVLSIMAFTQPFVFFYWSDNYLFMVIYCFIGFIFTCIGIVKTYRKWRINGLSDLVWSLLVPVISILSLYFLDAYKIDAQIFMRNREAVVSKIKKSAYLMEQLGYTHKIFLPISIKNYVKIEGTANELTIYFQTVDDGFVGIYERGVMYCDKPERINAYEKRLTNVGGVVDESSFTIKKIKTNWYFYEYKIHNISD